MFHFDLRHVFLTLLNISIFQAYSHLIKHLNNLLRIFYHCINYTIIILKERLIIRCFLDRRD